MRYASIRDFDISNGIGIGVSLFVQGCPIRCKDCFNQSAWDFEGGKEWNGFVKAEFMKLIDKPYIKRVSILGGEPLAPTNISDVLDLINEIRERFGDTKKIWIYTGYEFETRIQPIKEKFYNVDVIVDGKFNYSQKDLSLKYKGSKNQRIIDVQKTLSQDKIVEVEVN